jgi:hypothetical protein
MRLTRAELNPDQPPASDHTSKTSFKCQIYGLTPLPLPSMPPASEVTTKADVPPSQNSMQDDAMLVWGQDGRMDPVAALAVSRCGIHYCRMGELVGMTVGELVRWLLHARAPADGSASACWPDCPAWPPDVFAVAATLVDQSGCYAFPGVIVSRDVTESEAKRLRAETARLAGDEWREEWRWRSPGDVPPAVRESWKVLSESKDLSVVSDDNEVLAWHRAVLALMACSDEACRGVGFLLGGAVRPGGLALAAMEQFFVPAQNQTLSAKQRCSLALVVDPDRACVMPKALTPEVGCTLRSLSHNLALLPGRGIAKANWIVLDDGEPSPPRGNPGLMNMLVVPFPFVVYASDFEQASAPANNAASYFAMRQRWLDEFDGEPAMKDRLARLVEELVNEASREVGELHQIVFPEAALTEPLLESLTTHLSAKFPSLEFIVAGTMKQVRGLEQNHATAIRLMEGRRAGIFSQRKHHRWKLTREQIETYGLARQLDPQKNWWENIHVDGREIWFAVNGRNWVQATLVCEDLARVDPVLPVINAIGPNLLIALLQDGPQLVNRWPARYATVLAEDPGSAVLTLTSLGMVERARPLGLPHRRVIGLWKDGFRGAVELELPCEAQALVLGIRAEDREQWTMDRRRDGGTSTRLQLVNVRPVRLKHVPNWIQR